MNPSENNNFTSRSGFVSIIGSPNVGKSTLLNQLLGTEISITANKPQTTRNQILGIISKENYQAILIDTPGIHLPHNELHKRIVNYAFRSITEAEIVFYMMEPMKTGKTSIRKKEEIAFEYLQKISTPVILIINKIDLFTPEDIAETIRVMNQKFNFQETIPISALKKKGLSFIFKMFETYLPYGPFYYPKDQITDTPEKQIVGEFIREQIFQRCHKEIPYGTAIDIESFQEQTNIIKIYATIFVERESQKGIILGKKGKMLQSIGRFSRQKMEVLLGKKVFLDLHVKVVKNWSQSKFHLQELGYPE